MFYFKVIVLKEMLLFFFFPSQFLEAVVILIIFLKKYLHDLERALLRFAKQTEISTPKCWLFCCCVVELTQ